MAERKVLTDPNLLNIILDFAGKEIKKSCEVCGKILKYQILNQNIKYPYKKYINLEICEKMYFCDEECLNNYKKNFSNKKFCAFLFIIFIILGLIIFLIVYFSWLFIF